MAFNYSQVFLFSPTPFRSVVFCPFCIYRKQRLKYKWKYLKFWIGKTCANKTNRTPARIIIGYYLANGCLLCFLLYVKCWLKYWNILPKNQVQWLFFANDQCSCSISSFVCSKQLQHIHVKWSQRHSWISNLTNLFIFFIVAKTPQTQRRPNVEN